MGLWKIPSLRFEPPSVEGGLEEMDGTVVGVDDDLAIGGLFAVLGAAAVLAATTQGPVSTVVLRWWN